MRPTVPATMVTRSWAWRATGRDLRRSARILSCAVTLLKTRKPARTASVSARIQKRKKPATASEGAEIPISDGAGKILEPRELLKLKKEAFAARALWKERDDPGALERWIQADKAKAAEEAQPTTKRTRLVMRRLPDWLIIVMKTDPYLIEPIPAERLAEIEKRSYGFTETYLMRKFIDDKMYAYEQALVNQYDILGYAEDVSEVTDDEQDVGVIA